MTAKEYLNQIREKDAAINRMIRQKENLKGMLYTIGSPDTGEKVQTSKSGSSRYEELFAKISEKEDEINNKIDDLVGLKIRICEQINELPDPDKTTLDFGATVSVKRTGGGVNGVIEFEVTMTVQTDITYTDPA